MKYGFYSIMAILACSGANSLCAQDIATKPRLKRPAVHSPDGKLYADSTVGSLVVETIGDMRRSVAAIKTPQTADTLADYLYCKSGGTSDMASFAAKEVIKKATKADKALLRANDPDAIHALAIAAIGFLDNVPAKAITDDEAIGPGDYHDPVGGMEQALQICHFYGHLS